ncbi:replication protein A 70 kDa DNA-binding subunit D isoform X2 [Spinacia oleracea]|uniref:Replication protein A 70 kDa DNA-binding subunit D isoform X2 n=1 Tax=Spinacia oleracea TaxID=3562 RepID=A0ABM3R4T9_SPIOL|nr:replication protein A 70 kDa DNA-binding subunit D-like isoform X2 [Spinacia oleracea]
MSSSYAPFMYLHPYYQSWNVKARLIRSYDIQHVKNGRKIWKMVLLDATVQVIPADNWLRVVQNPYQLNITKETKVLVVDTYVEDFPTYYFNLVSLHGVQSFKHAEGNVIDVMGVVIYASEIESVGPTGTIKQDIVILDQSYFAMRLTIWNHFVDEIGDRVIIDIFQNLILLACGVQVQNFNGSYLTTGKYTRLYINHKDPISSSLAQWYGLDHFAQLKARWIQTRGISLHRTLLTSNACRTTISKFTLMPKGKTYRVLGVLVDIDVKSFDWYDACSICNNKVYYVGDQVTCYKCSKKHSVQVVQGVSVKITIKDSNRSMCLLLFNKQVEFVLQSSTSQLKEWHDQVIHKEIIKTKWSCLFTSYVFILTSPTITSALSSYKVTYVTFVNWEEECAYLLKRVRDKTKTPSKKHRIINVDH